MAEPIFHLLPYATWLSLADQEAYRPESLATDGFVHFSGDEATLLTVANTGYRDLEGPIAVLVVDPKRLTAEVRIEGGFPHVYGPIERSAVITVKHARRTPDGRYVAVVDRPPTAETLELLPHPEGGWYRETWRSPIAFEPQGYGGRRAAATGILFLLAPAEESRWHRVRSDELWLWHSGGPLELTLGGDGSAPAGRESLPLGDDLSAGQLPQRLVSAGTWQAARPATNREVLVSCVVAPGFDFTDFELLPADH
ncbi:MAG: cupin domain-containing protein [Micromonosporaceae bacterium]